MLRSIPPKPGRYAMKRFLMLASLIAAIPATLVLADDKKAKPYPLDKCLISDEKFEGSDMKPYEFVEGDQTIKLCCKSCLKKFNSDKAANLKKLSEEVAKLEKKSK